VSEAAAADDTDVPMTTDAMQVRIHGRGGQGVVTAAELLSVAAFCEGLHAQAFPSFGSERTGAPVVSFCRIARAPIRSHEPVSEPDVVLIQDPTLLHHVDVFSGLQPQGWVLINSGRSVQELGLDDLERSLPVQHMLTIAATDIARDTLGRPLPNAVLLGALAGMTHVVSLESVLEAIRRRFRGPAAAGNAAGAARAYALVGTAQREVAGARTD
jgi:pyruvate ferredoxin oxidoreductase gamma subunit